MDRNRLTHSYLCNHIFRSSQNTDPRPIWLYFTSELRYEVRNESESKMHLVRSFGVKWHKSNMIVKPFIKSDLNKQLHLSGQILKTSLLSHITAGSSWLIIHDSSFMTFSRWLNHFSSEVLHCKLRVNISIQGFVENDPSPGRLFTKLWFHCCPFMFVPDN